MAEAILRREARHIVQVESAGSDPAKHVHPKAIQVMNEVGIDISQNRSKHLNEFLDRYVHTVITVCGNEDEAVRSFPAPLLGIAGVLKTPRRQKALKTRF